MDYNPFAEIDLYMKPYPIELSVYEGINLFKSAAPYLNWINPAVDINYSRRKGFTWANWIMVF